jgi:hypothetical protein
MRKLFDFEIDVDLYPQFTHFNETSKWISEEWRHPFKSWQLEDKVN